MFPHDVYLANPRIRAKSHTMEFRKSIWSGRPFHAMDLQFFPRHLLILAFTRNLEDLIVSFQGHCNNKGLLTELEVCTVKYRTEVFSTKNRSPIFHGTDRTS